MAASTPLDPPAPKPFKLSRRFDRAARLVGEPAMERLARSKVAVYGLGGVGSFAAEALARAGVGHLVLCDFDTVCVTNANRQLHALQGNIGKPKAELVAERLRLVNPEATVEAVAGFYEEQSADRLFVEDATYVVDCIDNMKAKLHLLKTCVEKRVPVVSSMGSGGRLDPTMVRVADLADTWNCPFAKDVRKLLARKWGVKTDAPTGIAAVFSPERPRDPAALSYDHDGFLCVCPHKDNEHHTCDHRTAILGSAGFVTGTFGLVAASVAVRRIAAGLA